jgi:hypothetical protein
MWNLTCLSDIVLDYKLDGDKIILPHNVLSEYIDNGNNNGNNNSNNGNNNSNNNSNNGNNNGNNDNNRDTVTDLENGMEADGEYRDIDFPLSFKISNANKEIIVSVLDFTGDPDTVVIPQWLFYNLYPLQLGDIVSVSVYSGGYTNNKLSKGTCITLRPHTIDFLDITDHKAILEHNLKHYSILNKYTTIAIEYLDVQYNIDVIDTKPDNVIDIINSDLEVEFAPPINSLDTNILNKDCPECNEMVEGGDMHDDGVVMHDDGVDVNDDRVDVNDDGVDVNDDGVDGVRDSRENKFVPFSGKGHVLGSS